MPWQLHFDINAYPLVVAGVVDGTYINITAPPNSGTGYHYYKGNNSIVLMVVCDADYMFLCTLERWASGQTVVFSIDVTLECL